jgi:hypothetical protein
MKAVIPVMTFVASHLLIAPFSIVVALLIGFASDSTN